MSAPIGTSSSSKVAASGQRHGEEPEQGSVKTNVPTPKALPEVYEPTAQEIAQHSLTHLPYRRWCKFCVAARMANVPHWSVLPFSRDVPLLVMDYCFLKHANDEAVLTTLTYLHTPCNQGAEEEMPGLAVMVVLVMIAVTLK